MSKMTKLTQKQLEVLRLMNEGWELGVSNTGDGQAWLQQGGAGRDGDVKLVNRNTLKALYLRILIKEKYSFPYSTFYLTKAGKEHAND